MEKQSFPYPKLPRYWRPVFFIRSDVRFGIMGEVGGGGRRQRPNSFKSLPVTSLHIVMRHRATIQFGPRRRSKCLGNHIPGIDLEHKPREEVLLSEKSDPLTPLPFYPL